jgi:23S rRNA (uracil1939-C5)-methyltransferase
MKNTTQNLVTAKVVDLNHSGESVGVLADGKKVFFFGALPGEQVSLTVQKKKRHFDLGKLDTILTSSPDRTEPVCEHFAICGGCSLQYLNTEAQLAVKQKSLLDQLKKIAGVEPTNVLPAILGPTTGYRNKARLGVRYVIKKDKVLVGFREKDSRYLADINSCKVLNPRVGNLIAALKKLITSLVDYEKIAQIEVAIGDTDVALVIRNLCDLQPADQIKLQQFGEIHQLQIYLQPKGPDTIYKIWPEDSINRLRYKLANGLEFLFHPSDFTQINPAINKKMVTKAIELLQLTAEDTILDLFCGLGNFTLPIAQHVHHIIGIEGSDTMVERAAENAKHNNITNTEFYSRDLMQENLELNFLQNHKITKVLLDPPRAGAKECIPILSKLKPSVILYVSCNPATLSRDTKSIIDLGYTLDSAGIMDMFPHTMHIESMALFYIN